MPPIPLLLRKYTYWKELYKVKITLHLQIFLFLKFYEEDKDQYSNTVTMPSIVLTSSLLPSSGWM